MPLIRLLFSKGWGQNKLSCFWGQFWKPFPIISLLLVMIIKAVGSIDLIYCRSKIAWGRFITVMITVFGAWVKAPFASYTVALWFSLSVMKRQIGSGLLQMMLKDLHRLIFSITESIRKDFTTRPNAEYNPTCIPNVKNEIPTTVASAKNSALPILMLVNFRSIIAIISVPPLEAPT